MLGFQFGNLFFGFLVSTYLFFLLGVGLDCNFGSIFCLRFRIPETRWTLISLLALFFVEGFSFGFWEGTREL